MKKELDRSKAIIKTKLGTLKDEVKAEQSRALIDDESEGSLLRFP